MVREWYTFNMGFNDVWLNKRKGIFVTFLWSMYGFFLLYKNGNLELYGLSSMEVNLSYLEPYLF